MIVIHHSDSYGWAKMYDLYQSYALQARLKILLIYDIDAMQAELCKNPADRAAILPIALTWM